jgi:hypothetical protein
LNLTQQGIESTIPNPKGYCQLKPADLWGLKPFETDLQQPAGLATRIFYPPYHNRQIWAKFGSKLKELEQK